MPNANPTSDRVQIFGYTETASPARGEYVRFLSMTEEPDGSFHAAMRNSQGGFTELQMPTDSAVEMALAILLTVRKRDAREAGLPEPKSIFT